MKCSEYMTVFSPWYGLYVLQGDLQISSVAVGQWGQGNT